MTGEFAIAIHAIVYLDRNEGWHNSEALARNVCTNPARIRKVMSKLKRTALIEAREGAVGGYRFCQDPKQITLLRVYEAVEMPVVNSCWRSGDPEMDCMVASGMAEVMDGVYREMENCCRQKLGAITIQDVIDKLSSRQCVCAHVT